MTMETVRVFIGYDASETVAWHVLAHSIQERASLPVAITPVMLSQLKSVYRRPVHALASTEFSFSRFLVPYLSGYEGWAVFMDCDMLCRADIAALWQQRDPSFAVQVVQHDHAAGRDADRVELVPREGRLGQAAGHGLAAQAAQVDEHLGRYGSGTGERPARPMEPDALTYSPTGHILHSNRLNYETWAIPFSLDRMEVDGREHRAVPDVHVEPREESVGDEDAALGPARVALRARHGGDGSEDQ